MEGNLEEWADLLNLWPLVEREAQRLIASTHAKLREKGETQDIGAVRLLQGKMEGIQGVLTIPRRAVEALEKRKKREEKHDG